MPAAVDAELARRGGVKRWRTVTLPDGRRARVAVVRRPGPRGGRAVLVKILR
jgi:hypothetical protein